MQKAMTEPPPDIEKGDHAKTLRASASLQHEDMVETSEISVQAGRFSSLKATQTSMSAQSAIQAAQALTNFASAPENPRNWSSGKKWKVTLTIALTGFISTCGSSIAVPGLHEIIGDFGIQNEKVGILVTSFYVLGLG